MRSLALVALLGVAAVSHHRGTFLCTYVSATASQQQYPSTVYPKSREDFCPAKTITSTHTTVSMDTVGTIYYADGCTVVDGALVTFFAQEAPRVPSKGWLVELTDAEHRARSTIIGSVTNSVFKPDSQVLVAMPTTSIIDIAVPVHIYIQDNNFRAQALIRFYGSYPPNSKLIITGNTVENASAASRYPTMVGQCAAILGWQSNKDFYMRHDCRLEISENTVTVSSTDTTNELRGIGVWNYVYMGANSIVAINKNRVTVKGTRGKWSGGIDAFAYIAEGSNTNYEMLGNVINVDNGFAIGSPYARFPENEAQEMRFPTKVLVSRNSGIINRAVYFPTSKADGDVIYVGNSKNSLTSTIEISHNSFTILNSDANIRVAQTELKDTASVKVLANTLVTSGGNPRIIFSWNMSAYDDSRVFVTHNTARRSDFGEFYPGSFILYYRGYNLYNRSVSQFSHNTFNAENAGRKAFMLDRYPEMPFNVHSPTCFKMCANTYYDTNLTNDQSLLDTMPSYVTPYVAPYSACPAEPLPFPAVPDIPEVTDLFDPNLRNVNETGVSTTIVTSTSQTAFASSSQSNDTTDATQQPTTTGYDHANGVSGRVVTTSSGILAVVVTLFATFAFVVSKSFGDLLL